LGSNVIENGTIRKLGYGFHSNYGGIFSRFNTINERDGQTPHDGICHAYACVTWQQMAPDTANLAPHPMAGGATWRISCHDFFWKLHNDRYNRFIVILLQSKLQAKLQISLQCYRHR